MPTARHTECRRRHRASSISSPIYCSQHVLVLLTTGSLFTKAVSSPIPDVAHYHGPSTAKLYSDQQTLNVRVAAATCAAISMVASFTIFYWFCRMEKRFRHRLIILLILGDLLKAMWLFLQAVASIALGTIGTESSFCQASGFLVQFGTELSDFAVLCIALHSALQVFQHRKSFHSDGLYPYRYYLYVGAFLIPAIMGALAFTNPRWGYMSQGPYCSLPLRPFWYRLALQWIPRYLIAIVIIGLAVAIYAYVGFEFRSLSQLSNTRPSISTATQTISVGSPIGSSALGPEMSQYQMTQTRRGSSVISMIGASRRASAVTSVDSQPNSPTDIARVVSVPGSSHTADQRPMLPQFQPYAPANGPSVEEGREAAFNGTDNNSDGNASPFSDAPTQHLRRQQLQKKARIHRQLRLMFIYPFVYILIWLFPFVNHCMMYNDKFAANPVYWLSVLNVVCVCSMGAIDCLVFSLRERPWRHIPTSDGSFFGSFIWWRTLPRSNKGHTRSTLNGTSADIIHRVNSEANPETPYARQQNEGWKSSVLRVGRNAGTHTRSSASSSDHAKVQASMARTRLELEKEDRRVKNRALEEVDEALKMQKGRRGTVMTSLTAMTGLETIESPADEKRGDPGVAGVETMPTGEEGTRNKQSGSGGEGDAAREHGE